jgi:hypothetical protein
MATTAETAAGVVPKKKTGSFGSSRPRARNRAIDPAIITRLPAFRQVMSKGIRGAGTQLGCAVQKWGLRGSAPEALASAGQLFAHFGVETPFADVDSAG